MAAELITKQDEFEELCVHVRAAGQVAFDTEFVSEYTYRPQLCLLQLATHQRCAAVDPFDVKDLSSWWSLMADDQTTVITHGGREEVRFCVTRTGLQPKNLVDVQIAQGLLSTSFPLNHAALLERVLDIKIAGKEARTDWRRRPLTDKQIHYALADVRHLLEVWDRQRRSLEAEGRSAWAEAEFFRMVEEVDAERTRENWLRLSGIHSLRPRELAVVRELFQWRDREAEHRDRPVRKTIRDDLLIELARRQPHTVEDLLAVRDMNRGPYYKKITGQLLQAIARGLAVDESALPATIRRATKQDEQVLGKLLAIALANRCAEMKVALSLVGTSTDLQHLVRWHALRNHHGDPPRITVGWRAEVCGDLLTDILDGKIALRVGDCNSKHPLIFESVHPKQ